MFRSKIDVWLLLLLLGIPAWRIAAEWSNHGTAYPPVSFWILVTVLAVFVIGFIPIRYVIEGTTVSVQLGLIGWEFAAFHVEDVRSIRPSHNVLASPALSLSRLRVELGFDGPILISPKDQAGFLRAIGALDPQLRIVDGSLVRAA
ncbi:MAG: PH domain-containing protein [Bryobacteraceae bacterium]